MTEEQKKKYDESAKGYALRNAGFNSEYISEKSFKAGAEHAHSEGFNQGWNESLDKAIELIENCATQGMISEEIKRLKR